MTDREFLIQFLDQTGIVYEIYESAPHSIYIREGTGPHNKGYHRFYTVFDFDENGKLEEVGAYE